MAVFTAVKSHCVVNSLTKTAKMTLNNKQQEALRIAQSGHNIAILGQAGVGKSFTVKKIKFALERDGRRVAVTCTTGIACANFENAMTIHRFCGIKDGRHTMQDLRRSLDLTENHTAVRIRSVDTLIIDEISMLSYKMLSQVEGVCRLARKNQQMFGGLQVIVSGDFFQLPPVPNMLYGDAGDFAFSGPLWCDGFPHHVILDDVVRQSEVELIHAVRDTSIGHLTSHTKDFLESLDRPFDDQRDIVNIFSTNQQVDIFNQGKIMDLPGQLKIFHSDDWGEKKCLDRLQAPKSLWLKDGCQVILLRNLTDDLVNGSIGRVAEIGDDYVDVDFKHRSARIERHTFGVYNPSLKTDVARRLQFPLALCYALTVHKSQGMTIDRLQIDCEGMFRAGQLGVAIGRAKSIKGLRVINFHPHAVIPQDEILFEFYNRKTSPLLDEKECCQHDSTSKVDEMSAVAEGPTSVFDSCDDVELIEASDDVFGSQPDEDDFDEEDQDSYGQDESMMALQSAKPMYRLTDLQKDVNAKIEELINKKNIVERFCSLINHTISKLYAQTIDLTSKTANVTKFYILCKEYLASRSYTRSVTVMFDTAGTTEYHICYKMFLTIRDSFLKKKSEDAIRYDEEDINPRSTPVMNEATRAKVRYVGGYCFRRLLTTCSDKIRSNGFKTRKGSFGIVTSEYRKKRIIGQIIRKQNIIVEETKDAASLREIKRKQNIREGLLHITDSAYEFTIELCKQCISLQTESNLHRYGRHLHVFVAASLKKNITLFTEWIQLFSLSHTTGISSCNSITDCVEGSVNFVADMTNSFDDFVEIFTRIMTRQHLKDTLEHWETKKKEAHRKDIKMKKGDNKQTLSITQIRLFSSDQSRVLLQANLQHDPDALKSFTVKELHEVGASLGVTFPSKKRKDDMIQSLKSEILQSDVQKGSKHPVAKPSSECLGKTFMKSKLTKGKGREKGKMKKSHLPSEYPCGICGEDCYMDSVACDLCDRWFHGNCLKIHDLDSLPDEWFCHECTE